MSPLIGNSYQWNIVRVLWKKTKIVRGNKWPWSFITFTCPMLSDDSLAIMQRWQEFKVLLIDYVMVMKQQKSWSKHNLIANKSQKSSLTSEKKSFACERSLNETDST